MLASSSDDSGPRTIAALLEALAASHGLDAAAVLRVWSLLAPAAFPGDARPSRILSEGTPFEIAVSVTGSGTGLRYLTELGSGGNRKERWQDARRRLPRLVEALGLPHQPFLEVLEPVLIGPPDRVDSALAFGPWIAPAMSRSGNGLRLYVNATWWPEGEFWRALHRLLERLRWGCAVEALKRLRTAAKTGGRPYGLALENGPYGPGRVKAYFRGAALSQSRVTRVAEKIGVDAEALAVLWRLLFSDQKFGARNAVLSVGMSEGVGVTGVKVDVEASVLALTEHELGRRVTEVARRQSSDAAAYRAMLAAGESSGVPLRHTVLAIASGRAGPRMSAYLAPIFKDRLSFVRALRALFEP